MTSGDTLAAVGRNPLSDQLVAAIADVTHNAEDLVRWLDVQSVEGPTVCGQPGFPALRAAWVGLAPATEELWEQARRWAGEQGDYLLFAEWTFERLLTAEPPDLEADPQVIPGWFPTWWCEVFLSLPWDERLPAALAAANDYLVRNGHPDEAKVGGGVPLAEMASAAGLRFPGADEG